MWTEARYVEAIINALIAIIKFMQITSRLTFELVINLSSLYLKTNPNIIWNLASPTNCFELRFRWNELVERKNNYNKLLVFCFCFNAITYVKYLFRRVTNWFYNLFVIFITFLLTVVMTLNKSYHVIKCSNPSSRL